MTRREVRVGIFLSGALLLLALLILFVGNVQELFKKPGYRVYALFDSALGLEKNAAVKMAGIKIGLVKDISLDGRRARVTMSIYPNYRIPHGSRVTLASLGILGEKYVEIVPGKEDTYYEPEEIMESLPPISFDQLGTLLLSMGEDVKRVSNSVNNVIIKDLGPNLKKTLENLQSLTADLDTILKENRETLRQTIQETDLTVKNFNQQVTGVSQGVQETLAEVRGLIKDNRQDVRESLEKLKHNLDQLQKTIESLNHMLQKIEKGEGTAGRLVNDPTLYEETKEAVNQVKSISSTVSALSPMAGIQGWYYGESEKFKGMLGAGFNWKNRLLFSAGVSNRLVDEHILYSLQGGLRFRHLSLRAGLIESKFGAGLDLSLLKDRLSLSVEGFDFNRSSRPQFRFYGRVFPTRNFFLLAGLDDFSLSSNREFFFGLGWTWR
ncbi:MAG: MCE family protein [Candidatus Aminicenantes bacterium]|nr:MCE family protein [Candidatus Aminicenantes bacterium]